YLNKSDKWRLELKELRSLLLDCGLVEEYKWRAPCYTFEGSNVAILAALKNCCTLSFFKGALLKDPRGVLGKPGENTRAARVIRFAEVQEIIDLRPVLHAYLQEAIKIEQAGLKVDTQAEQPLDLPTELQVKLDALPALKRAFAALTPGRQRAYLLFFSAAKQSKTRAARVDQYTQRILNGKGLNDCVCGLSKKPPGCDGSHKQLESGKPPI
ncbi:MAG: YdeI/OmpD-associated family protein, partial [Planctomycetales bacterium]|nr:YdeI/OmpD-associated family protein [Planctomycetales bacterium]